VAGHFWRHPLARWPPRNQGRLAPGPSFGRKSHWNHPSQHRDGGSGLVFGLPFRARREGVGESRTREPHCKRSISPLSQPHVRMRADDPSRLDDLFWKPKFAARPIRAWRGNAICSWSRRTNSRRQIRRLVAGVCGTSSALDMTANREAAKNSMMTPSRRTGLPLVGPCLNDRIVECRHGHAYFISVKTLRSSLSCRSLSMSLLSDHRGRSG
jgi:hypothetical protein